MDNSFIISRRGMSGKCDLKRYDAPIAFWGHFIEDRSWFF
jgi:hypothetical protein